MGRLHKFAAVMALALGSIASAQAADPPYMPPMPSAPLLVEEYGAGWYLRGDIGYRQNMLGQVHIDLAPYYPVNNRLNESLNFGGGFGYKYGWFRADMTFDYGGALYRGDTSILNDYREKVEAFVGLINGYIDLGTWNRFTPYIGAGVGASLVTSMHFTSLMYPTPEPVHLNKKWNGAWAAMAGVAYHLTNEWLLDVGYRYLSYGTAKSDYDFFRNRLEIKDLTSHELRLGLRYAFD